MTENDSSTPTLADCALAYARQGWPIFRLQPESKAPHALTAGVNDAPLSTAQVVDLWADSPQSNIGYAIPSDQIVVDVDPRNGGLLSWKRMLKEHGPIPVTRSVMSGRGDGGQHYYFRRPDGDLYASLKPVGYAGVDVKRQGGYVLLPPSVHPDTGRPYRWIDLDVFIAQPPAWLTELMTRPPQEPRPELMESEEAIDILRQLDIQSWTGVGLIERMREATEGERNHVLNWALWRLRADRIESRMGLEQFRETYDGICAAASASGLDDIEIRRTASSVFRKEET